MCLEHKHSDEYHCNQCNDNQNMKELITHIISLMKQRYNGIIIECFNDVIEKLNDIVEYVRDFMGIPTAINITNKFIKYRAILNELDDD